ncbi:MAG: HAMP domain-containing histidine kinase [Micrococcales bacterium]|nr:HAMP domain-containing histidine kinase [Micrococcales bacterium]MCL2667889.1 HAMP domain-containing histidine kinase [Micrococcales bacterium]
MSVSFDFYARLSPVGARVKMGLVPALVLLTVCVVVACWSVWRRDGRGRPGWWRRLDYVALVAVALLVSSLCVLTATAFGHASDLALVSALAYATVMAVALETVARLREGTFAKSMLWVRFFERFPPSRLPGLLMALMLAGHTVYVVTTVGALLFDVQRRGSDVYIGVPELARRNAADSLVTLVLSSLSLVGLTYLCAFLLSLSTRYERASAETVRAERFKAELITNVSHDIRTPLTAIISYVDLLKELPVDAEDFTEYVDVLDRKSQRLKTLIDDLMDASKAATGNLEVNLQGIDLSEIAGQVAGELDDQLTENDLTLVFRQPEDSNVVVQADSAHLWRVLENLFGNVAKYAQPGTRAFVEITSRDAMTVLSLRNTSRDPIDLPADALTEQFIRGDRARRTDGNGLGLYIAKSLTELMGGRLQVRATGDLFEVEVLLRPAPA